APLCAIGVAIAIALDQLCPGRPGILDGNRSVTVGTTQETSPMSSEPPLIRARGGPLSESSVVARPGCALLPTSACTAFASIWSSALHSGRPTALMCSYVFSAMTLLK